jgi:adenylylsulfate kinase
MSIVKNDTASPAFALWITGLPASGKSVLASAVVRELHSRGVEPVVLESDQLRKIFSEHPTYDERDREYFYMSLAFVGQILVEHGMPVIFDATANRRSYRRRARQAISRFVEVFVDSPLEVCVRRDPKGIYRRAQQDKANQVPGMGSDYEVPENPDIVIRGDRDNPEESAQRVIDLLVRKGFLAGLAKVP